VFKFKDTQFCVKNLKIKRKKNKDLNPGFSVIFLPPKAEQLSPKFYKLVLGLVESIDAKGIDVAQPIWP
jgi:hypothetical protein